MFSDFINDFLKYNVRKMPFFQLNSFYVNQMSFVCPITLCVNELCEWKLGFFVKYCEKKNKIEIRSFACY